MAEVRVEISDEDVVELARFWWLTGLLGLFSLIAGVILVIKPSHSLATLAVVFGIFLLIDGISAVVSSFGRSEGNRALAAIVGLLGIIIGIILIRHPTHAVAAIGLLIGIWLVAAGVVRLAYVIASGVRPLLGTAIALLEIVVGIAVVSDPHIGYATLAVLTGLWLIVNGGFTIAMSWVARNAV